ncbi:phage/plasmid primase, P4 family [Scytonema sp. NUACC26]|uniref:DNA primase family protein n=1 Tax=Scytonema sp. NUACC26 TaxID=3140176 RepID=UPI0034DC8B61
MINKSVDSFDDKQNSEIMDCLQDNYASTPLLLPESEPVHYPQKYNAGIANTSQEKSGGCPEADILGKEIAEQYRGKLIFNIETNCWMYYELEKSSGIWSKVHDYYLEGIVNQELEQRNITGYGSSSYISNIIHKMRVKLMERNWVEKPPTELLPFQNCVLEIATGKTLKHSPAHRFTWCLPREFDNSSNEFPQIDKWLNEVTNNEPSIKEILLCYLAAILKGRADLQQFLHLLGSGGTGKSTFVQLAQSLIGDRNVCTMTLAELCGQRFSAANAFKKRLVVFPDQDRYKGDLQKFKSLTGQDMISAEEKGKPGFEFKFDGMVIMASNDLVFDTRNSSWLTRRHILVSFKHTVDKTKRRDLEKEFQPELNALTQYLLAIPDETVTQVLRNAADNPELAQHSLEQQLTSNPMAVWIDECVIREEKSKSPVGNNKEDTKTLFGSYTQWCRKSGSYAQSSPNFSPNLLNFCNSIMGWKDVEKVRSNKGYCIQGLRLREPGKDDDLPSPLAGSVESNLHSEG